MTKGEAKKLALRWLDEATINGQNASVELTADLTDKFNYMLTGVLSYIAEFFKLEKQYTVTEKDGTPKGGYIRFVMPDDYKGLSRVAVYDNDGYYELEDFYPESRNIFLLPKGITGNIEFNYYAEPAAVDITADDSTVLDIVKRAEPLLPLKLAIDATAGSEDTSALSAYLDSKFSNMLANLLQNEITVYTSIKRIYAM